MLGPRNRMSRRPPPGTQSGVIPQSWTPVTRPADGERVGYLAGDGADGLVVPTSLVGLPLGAAQRQDPAVALLRERGLAALDRRLPSRLPSSALSAVEPEPGWGWRPVVLVEVSPVECTVRLEFAEPAELRGRAVLPVPVGDLRRPGP
jgi:hypothetical protein